MQSFCDKFREIGKTAALGAEYGFPLNEYGKRLRHNNHFETIDNHFEPTVQHFDFDCMTFSRLVVNSRTQGRVSHAILFRISFRNCSDPRTKKTRKSVFLFPPSPSRFPTGLMKLKFLNLFFPVTLAIFFLRCRPLLRRQEAVR